MGKLNLPYKEPTRLMFKSGNPKTDKNKSVEGLENIVVLHLNFAPADLSGYNVCPMASQGCKSACLHTAGNPVFQAQKDKGRINRARFYMQNRDKFMTQLTKELVNFVKWCDKNKKIGVVRLNTTSDISWENYNLFEKFPDDSHLKGSEKPKNVWLEIIVTRLRSYLIHTLFWIV